MRQKRADTVSEITIFLLHPENFCKLIALTL